MNIPIQALGWAYHTSSRQRQKSAEEVMELLRYCADMNANLLLNIGPRPDGTILEENIQTLEKVGRQLEKGMVFPKIEYEIVYGLPYESETDGSDRKRKSDC